MTTRPHPLGVRIAARVVVATAGSVGLMFLILLSEPPEPGESAWPYYLGGVIIGLVLMGLYEGASLGVTAALSQIFGLREADRQPERPSIMTVRGGALMVGMYFFMILLVTVLAVFALAAAAAVSGRAPEIDPAHFAWILPLSMAAGALECWRVARRRMSPRDRVLLRRWLRPPTRSVLVATVVGGISVALIAALVLPRFVPISKGFEPGILEQMATGGAWSQFALVVTAIILAPPIEEFLFRGVLLEGFLRSAGAVAAVGVTTVLFAALHLSEIWGHWPGLVAILLVGALLAVLRLRTGSLVAPVVGHASYNTAAVVLTVAMTTT